jgi:hypothetical protein
MYVIPVGALLFLVNIPQLSIYPWHEDQAGWLSPNLYIARHLVLLALVFLVARKFLGAALRHAATMRASGRSFMCSSI